MYPPCRNTGSESAFAKLQEDAGKIQCRVRRSGMIVSLPIGDIVVGDIVLLQAGERIPADGILLSGRLGVDQSALNGESAEAAKSPGGDTLGDPMSGHSLFRGTIVCSGDGEMLVTRVGDSTFYGSLAQEVQEETRESPLKLRLSGLAKTLSHIGYAAAILVAVADLFHSFCLDKGMQWAQIAAQFGDPAAVVEQVLHALTLAITVVVVAVPEGLPMMITVVLSSNMRRMLRDHVLVRKLVGIETSGSLNILFTDKTGTLTKGKLEVSRFISGDGTEYRKPSELKRHKALWELVECSGVCNSDSQISGKKAIGGNATDGRCSNLCSRRPERAGRRCCRMCRLTVRGNFLPSHCAAAAETGCLNGKNWCWSRGRRKSCFLPVRGILMKTARFVPSLPGRGWRAIGKS